MKRFFLAALLLLFPAVSVHAEDGDNDRVSVSSSATQANAASSSPQVSSNARYVVFVSSATNLVSGDTNGVADVFVYDRNDGSTERISVSSGEDEADGASSSPYISASGRFVAFVSLASNLVDNDDNGVADCFLRSLETGVTVLLNPNVDGNAAEAACASPSVSDDGKLAVFSSSATDLVTDDTGSVSNVFLRDRDAGTTQLLSTGIDGAAPDGSSLRPIINGDGTYVAYDSAATNIIGDDDDNVRDVYLYSISGSTTSLVSRKSASGTKGDADSLAARLSEDGQYTVYQSDATNLVESDTNAVTDCFIYNSSSGQTERLSISTGGTQGNGACSSPAISGNDHYATFVSSATNLVSSDTNGFADIFVVDRIEDTTRRLSLGVSSAQPDGAGSSPSLSSDGNRLAWSSTATNLVASDSNAVDDVFVTENDICPNDGSKTEPGLCGCGEADTDTDSDSTVDCLDDCPSDANKTEAGSCGCGVSDGDANGNGVADCDDPTANTVPRAPYLVAIRGKVFVILLSVPGATYEVTYQKRGAGNTPVTFNTSRTNAALRKLSNGKWKIRYRLTLAGVTTKYSSYKSFAIPLRKGPLD